MPRESLDARHRLPKQGPCQVAFAVDPVIPSGERFLGFGLLELIPRGILMHTIGKPKYAAHEATMARALAGANELRGQGTAARRRPHDLEPLAI